MEARDWTYDTLRKGTNRLVCFDKSGLPGQLPFSIECTSLGNLDRVMQNMKFESEADRTKSARPNSMPLKRTALEQSPNSAPSGITWERTR